MKLRQRHENLPKWRRDKVRNSDGGPTLTRPHERTSLQVVFKYPIEVLLARNMGKRTLTCRTSHDWFWVYFWLDIKGEGGLNQSLSVEKQYLKELRHDILSRWLDGLNYSSSVGKPKNNSLLRTKNTKGGILKQKGTTVTEDGEDWNRLEMTILKSFVIFFKIRERWRSSICLRYL